MADRLAEMVRSGRATLAAGVGPCPAPGLAPADPAELFARDGMPLEDAAAEQLAAALAHALAPLAVHAQEARPGALGVLLRSAWRRAWARGEDPPLGEILRVVVDPPASDLAPVEALFPSHARLDAAMRISAILDGAGGTAAARYLDLGDEGSARGKALRAALRARIAARGAVPAPARTTDLVVLAPDPSAEPLADLDPGLLVRAGVALLVASGSP
jgi:hypothetical protein